MILKPFCPERNWLWFISFLEINAVYLQSIHTHMTWKHNNVSIESHLVQKSSRMWEGKLLWDGGSVKAKSWGSIEVSWSVLVQVRAEFHVQSCPRRTSAQESICPYRRIRRENCLKACILKLSKLKVIPIFSLESIR